MSLMKNKCCFIGGDRRQMYAAEILASEIKVNVIGACYSECVRAAICGNVSKAVHGCGLIVLPLPVRKMEEVVSFDELICALEEKNVVILGGKIPPYMKQLLEEKRIRYIDYYDHEVFALKNAYLTAEGALSYAMNVYDGDLRTANVAIIGYGRIGNALGEMLRGLMCRNVTVFARREEILALAYERGLDSSIISGEVVYDFDIIFNTVPSRIISDKQLLDMHEGTLLVELASAPGGFDGDIAVQSGIKVINAPGIPGSYAPKSAGRILADTITELMIKEGSV